MRIEGALGGGVHTVVHVVRKAGRRMAVKTLRAGRSASPHARQTFERLARRHAAASHPALPAVLDIDRTRRGEPYVTSAFVEGARLSKLCESAAVDEMTLVSLSVTVCRALNAVHQRGLVHGGVRPRNLILGPFGTTLVDPSLVWTIHRQAGGGALSRGHLTYGAPECLGLIDVPPDARSDLYSLGAVLYHAATGLPPFHGADRGALIASRLQRAPPPVSSVKPGLSHTFAKIVDKLLEPEPDARYQTAAGLLEDLSSMESLGIGARDHLLRLDKAGTECFGLEPVPFLGRRTELESVSAAVLEAARASKGSVMVVEGREGSGKAKLALEAVRFARRSGALVLRDKGLPTEATPFAELDRALGRWLDEDEGTVDAGSSSEAVIAASRGLAPYLVRCSERLARLLPDTPEPPFVPGAPQIASSAAEFLLRLADEVGPLVLIFEELQWLSDSMSKVIERLACRAERHPIVVLLTARTPDVHVGDCVRLLRRLRGAGRVRIQLSGLEEHASRTFVDAMLGAPLSSERLLGDVLERAAGNPLLLREHVDTLLDTGALRRREGRWETIEQRFSEPVGQPISKMVSARVKELSPDAQGLIMTMAAAAPCGHMGILADALGWPASKFCVAAAEAMSSGIVIRHPPFGYVFSHESLRGALYDSLPPDSRRRAHNLLAQAMERHSRDLPHTCQIAIHYALAEDEADPVKTLATNSTAGFAAMRMRAFHEAKRYLSAAIAAAPRAAAEGRHLHVALAASLGEASFQTGELDSAQSRLQDVVDGASTPLQRAKAHGRLADIHLSRFRTAEAWEEVQRGLDALGQRTGGPGRLAVVAVRSLIVGRSMLATGIGVGSNGRRDGLRDRTLVDLYLRGAQIGYLSFRRDRLVQMRLAAMQPAARLGLSPEQIAVFAHQGLLLSALGRRGSKRRLLLAGALSERMADPSVEAYVTALQARAATQLGDALEAERLGRLALTRHAPWLDPTERLFTAWDMAWGLLMRGHVVQAAETIRELLADMLPRATGARPSIHELPRIGLMACLSTLGRSSQARYHRDLAEEGVAATGEPFTMLAYLAHKLLLHRELRELGRPADETISAFESLGVSLSILPLHLRTFHVARAYVRIDQCQAYGPSPPHALVGELKRCVKDLERVAAVPILEAHTLVAKAALNRLEGRKDKARRALDIAEQVADALDAPWVLYEASCERARLLSEDNAAAARRAALIAFTTARDNGWRPRARRTHSEFALRSRRRGGGRPSPSRGDGRLDQALEMSMWAAQSTSPAWQLRLILDWLVKHFGCEQALVLRRDEKATELTMVAGRDVLANDVVSVSDDCLALSMKALKNRRPAVLRRDGGNEWKARIAGNGHPSPGGIRGISAPLPRGGRVDGVLHIHHREAAPLFTDGDVETLTTIAAHVPLLMETSDRVRLEIYERIATNVPGLVFQFALYPNGRRSYRFLSARVRLLDVEPEEARRDAEVLLERIHPEDRPAFEDSLRRSADTLKPWVSEGRYVLPDGRVKWFHGVAHPERQPGGELLWDGLIVDITRVKAVEARVRAMNRQLEARVEARTRELVLANQEMEAFTYSVSHDLRSPLLTIQGFAEELTRHLSDRDAQALLLLERICASSNRMQSLIEAMLALSKVAHQPLTVEEVDLSELAREILHTLHMNDPGRRVEFLVEPGVVARADEGLMCVVLQNLLSNSWKYSRHRDVAHINFYKNVEDGRDVFVVEDDGAGFDMEHAEQIFQPFRRLPGAQGFEGTGVGLATVRRVIQRHRGEVWARGEPGGGARIFFTLGS